MQQRLVKVRARVRARARARVRARDRDRVRVRVSFLAHCVAQSMHMPPWPHSMSTW